ncbi:MAG: bifunctional anthranilate synthase component I family protein/class IV aminotransferase [Actinomycetota bacterium]|nr:bifunctional anthranilate synthase component I family protein/class IV aminotransferase [Actinomycetota bacterium]
MNTSLASSAISVTAPFRIPLQSELSPEQAVLCLRGDRHPFALVGDWLGGMTVLGSEPLSVAPRDGDPFSVLGSQSETAGGDVAVGGGWVGWLGYQLVARIEHLPPPPPARALAAPFSLAFYDHVVLFDGERWWFEGLGRPEREASLRNRLEVWEERLRGEPPPPRSTPRTRFVPVSNGSAGHVAAVADCRERIVSGELLQANICLRFEGRFDGDPIDLFAQALARARPRFAALVDGIVSLSPERFLRRAGRRVWSEPVKGTATRIGTEQDQAGALDALLASSKDAAEHVMIVDLMRNDLGRVCVYGTVEVDPRRIEPHGALWHMVSTVSGWLREDVDDAHLVRATFPPGSVTGAPKVQAMKVIATLESTRREAYTGAIGIVSPLAGLDLSVAIRTFELSGGNIWLGAGGGIVADSDPENELAEALAKAAGPIGAIAGHIDDPSRLRQRAAPRLPHALSFGQRPDPSFGVFETVLVENSSPLHLDAHLRRLAASVRELYGSELPRDLRARTITVAAATSSRTALRILAHPDGSAAVEGTPALATDQPPVCLAAFVIPGGLGPHKWRDRRLVQALAAHRPGTVPVLVDTDGQVLEAAHANVWLAQDQALSTPPVDGRILPGVTRATLLASDGLAREEPFDLTRLANAEGVFLTSTIRGRHPARLARR